MSGWAEYDDYDGFGLAELVRAGEVSATELCEEAIRRTEALNPRINAVVTPMWDRARTRARELEPQGPFAGVPFLLKDILHAYAGVPMSYGSRALLDYVPEYDSELVRRFRRAGLVTLGKTNTPELALMGVTEPEAFGPSRNPWDLGRTPGGSSGGSAAAVAARIVPLASASDGGGSIRIPASCCGLFGLKPSRGRVPVGPQWGEVWDGASTDHVLTHTVRDSAAMLDATRGADPGAPYAVAPPERPYLDELARTPKSLRIGFNTRSPIGAEVHPECVAAVHRAAELLESLGHRVEEVEQPVDGQAVARAYITLYFGQVAADLRWIEQIRGRRAARRQIEDATRALGLIGRSLSSGEYVEAKRSWNTFAREMAAYHERYDLYLTPTIADLPVPIGALGLGRGERIAMRIAGALRLGRLLLASLDTLVQQSLGKTPFTQLANLTGQPAMSVPLHWTAEDLPMGVQFIAPNGDEALLFRLAAQLEAAQPWRDRRPPLLRTPEAQT